MKTIDIERKDGTKTKYVMVNARIKEFRENEKYAGMSLVSEIVSLTETNCVIKAMIIKDGIILATGFAQEEKGNSFINKTSYLENCETSAWGRALGNLGIGIDESIASAEEVINAMAKQIKQEEAEIIGGAFVLTGGKYSGKTIQEVYEEDRSYCQFCAEKSKSENIKQQFIKCIEDNKKEIEV